MQRIAALMEGMTPAQVLGIVAIAGLFLLAVGFIAVLMLALNRRAGELAAARAEAARLAGALAAQTAAGGAAPGAASGAPARPAAHPAGAGGLAGPWSRPPFAPPADHAARLAESIPVVALAGFEGGAGRTTLAAGLAAWFDARGERVLLIDLDPRGALSDLAGAGEPPGGGAAALLGGAWPGVQPLAGARSSSDMIAAGPTLAAAEMTLAADAGGEGDPRYRLAHLLLGPRIQTVYDRVILDTAPCPGPSLVNALCAATHLVIPTRLAGRSDAAVAAFLGFLDGLRPRPLPPVQQYRLLPAQTARADGRPTPAEAAALGRILALLARRAEPAHLVLAGGSLPMLPGLAAGTEGPAMPGAEFERPGLAVAGFAPSYAEAPEEE